MSNLATNNRNTYRQEASFDGFGYVNNRGKSKYWGVAKIPRSSRWRVAMFTGNPELNQSNEYATANFEINEKEAAWIAAYFYENPNYTLPVTVTSKDGNKEYRIGADRRISKFDVSSDNYSKLAKTVSAHSEEPIPSTTKVYSLDDKRKARSVIQNKLSRNQMDLLWALFEEISSDAPKSEEFYTAIENMTSKRIMN